MVERPIKKSERQTNAAPSDAVEGVATELNSVEGSNEATSPSTKERKIIPPVHRKEKTKGKGKGRETENEPLPVNRALVRGPKPKKLETAAQSEEIEPQEITSENASDQASEPTTADS